MKCILCARNAKGELCTRHNKLYVWEPNLQGYRLKKHNTGSRYIRAKFHKTEIKLAQIIEDYFGKSDVVTEFHPIWAKSDKGVLLEYDILLIKEKILVEFNGIQHYNWTKLFQKNLIDFLEQKDRDVLKAKLAKENNYTLITFKYDEPIVKNYVIFKIKGQQL